MDTTSGKDLTYHKFSAFDFKRLEGKNPDESSQREFYSVGTRKDVIAEIMHQSDDAKCVGYKLLVFNFSNFTLLVPQKQHGDEFYFYGNVLVILKNGKPTMRFVLNLFPQFEERTGYGGFSLSHNLYNQGIEEMSEIMFLDDKMRPTNVYKFIGANLVTGYSPHYDLDNPTLPRFDYTYFFFNSKKNPALSINSQTCIDTLYDAFKKADMVMMEAPEPYSCPSNPLWIYTGYRAYKHCFEYPDYKNKENK